jgi:hypothetical protein
MPFRPTTNDIYHERPLLTVTLLRPGHLSHRRGFHVPSPWRFPMLQLLQEKPRS